jgi:hypothetical protein
MKNNLLPNQTSGKRVSGSKHPAAFMRFFFAAFIPVFFVLGGCKKNENPAPALATVSSVKTGTDSTRLMTMAVTQPTVLGVSLYTNSTLKKGQTFIFNLSVKNGTMPASKAVIGIDDPVRGVCTSVMTGTNGLIQYSSYISPGSVSSFYQYRFYLPNGQSLLTTVAVYPNGRLFSLPSVPISINTVTLNGVSQNQMLLAIRAQNIGQPIAGANSYLNTGFGKDLLAELKSNPVGTAPIVVAAISCPTAIFFPPAGGVCIPAAVESAPTLAIASYKVIAKHLIQNSTTLTPAQKTNYSNAVDVSGLLIGVASFKLDKGLSLVSVTDAAAIAWDFNNVQALFEPSGSVFKSCIISGVIKSGPNAGTTCLMALLKK